jgi:hypothetical protein
MIQISYDRAVGQAQRNNRTPLLTPDAAAVSHIVWNGAGLVDRKGLAWTMTGTVPQRAQQAARPAGAGAFSDANYYATTAIGDPFDFAGDYTVHVLCQPTTTAGNQVLIHSGPSGTSGFYLQLASGTLWHGVSTPGAVSAQTGGTVLVGQLNVLSFGRAGGNIYVKANGSTTGVTAAAAAVSSSGVATTLGRYSAGAQPFSGTIYEVLATTTAWSESAVLAVHRRIRNLH